MGNSNIKVVQPTSGWHFIDFNELRNYKDLLFFLVWRDIKVLYAQTILGFSWAIIEPVVQIILFAVIFGKIAGVPTDGVPYVLFSTVAIVPWTYMSNAIQQSSQSLVINQGMLGKIYVPRLIFPIVPTLAKMVDFLISMVLVFAVSIYYNVKPTANLLLFPLFVMMMTMIASGVGMWLSALAIRFRDVRYALGFVLRMLMYSAPIVYSAASIDAKYRLIYSFNPLVGVIEGFRATLLGGAMPWIYIWPGILTSVILVVSGALYFKKMERIFADVI